MNLETTYDLSSLGIDLELDFKTPLDTEFNLIRDCVLDIYDLEWDFVNSLSRKDEAVMARNVIIYLCRKYTNLSLKQLGRRFHSRGGKGKDHSTMINSIHCVDDCLSSDKRFKAQFDIIKKNIEKNYSFK